MPYKAIKILVVDDSNTNIVLLDAIFSSAGFSIKTALSANEAFSEIEKEKPNLILLDLNMPNISGFDFLEKLRSDLNFKDIPVIVVSALTDDLSVAKSFSLGANEFINKPVDIPLLQKKVHEILKLS
jgi:CheY-like chemotaxis protein